MDKSKPQRQNSGFRTPGPLQRSQSSPSFRSRSNPEYTLPELQFSNFSDDLHNDYDVDYFDALSRSSSSGSDSSDVSDEESDEFRTLRGERRMTSDLQDPPFPTLIRQPSASHIITRKPVPNAPNVVRQPSRTQSGIARQTSRPIHRHRSVQSTKSTKSFTDPNLVTWSGPEDTLNPLNWTKRKKWISTILVSCFTFISPVASTMVAPALPTIAEEFNINTSIERVLVMSIFLLAYAVGPFLFGPLSEIFGRVVVLQCANMIYLIFNTACGFARTKEQMMAFRFLSGLGGSAPQAIGGGVLSDCWRAEERGSALAIYSLAPFLGPAVGPIAGGYITQHTTWRWIFHSTSIVDLGIQILAFLFLNETYAPAILAKLAKKLRKETGNNDLHTKWQGGPEGKTMAKLVQKSMIRPFVMLFTQPSLQAMALYRAYLYGLMYLVLSTFPMVFEDSYNQDVGRASLNYISLGVGFVVGLQISGPLQDKLYGYLKLHAVDPSAPLFGRIYRHIFRRKPAPPSSDLTLQKTTTNETSTDATTTNNIDPESQLPTKPSPTTKDNPSEGLPEHRLPLALPFGLLIPIGLLLYGWSAQQHWHWIIPNIGAAIMCIGLIITFNCAQAYVVDSYTNHAAGINYAASATGAAAFVRTMAGFSFPLFAPKMYSSLGVGWGNTVLGGVSLVLGVVAPLLLWRWGRWLRARSEYC